MTTIQDWQQSGQYLTYKNKHQIFYKMEGQGEVLLLLHGFPTASWDWVKIWPELAKRFTLVAPDYIGFGLSDKPYSYPYSILDQADIVQQILRNLPVKGTQAGHEIKSFHILAHDYGDTVAQELLARATQKETNFGFEIKSVVLLNGGIFPDAHQPLPIQKALMSPFGIFLTPFLGKSKLRENFNRIFGKQTQATEQEIDEFYFLMSRDRGKYIFHKLIRYMAERVQYRERWLAALQQQEIPIRLINGLVDPISGKLMVDYYEKFIPNPDVIKLETIGHYPQTEAPEQVLSAFIEFHKKNETHSA